MRRGLHVLLLTGPSGSRKSTLATELGTAPGWAVVCEDDLWVADGVEGLRAPDQERAVQGEVLRLLEQSTAEHVVVEFILYSRPPNPLTAYRSALSSRSIDTTTVVLRLTVDEVMSRLVDRGRPRDLHALQARRLDAENQIRILDDPSIDPSWIVDVEGRAPEELAELCRAIVARTNRVDADRG